MASFTKNHNIYFFNSYLKFIIDIGSNPAEDSAKQVQKLIKLVVTKNILIDQDFTLWRDARLEIKSQLLEFEICVIFRRFWALLKACILLQKRRGMSYSFEYKYFFWTVKIHVFLSNEKCWWSSFVSFRSSNTEISRWILQYYHQCEQIEQIKSHGRRFSIGNFAVFLHLLIEVIRRGHSWFYLKHKALSY